MLCTTIVKEKKSSIISTRDCALKMGKGRGRECNFTYDFLKGENHLYLTYLFSAPRSKKNKSTKVYYSIRISRESPCDFPNWTYFGFYITVPILV